MLEHIRGPKRSSLAVNLLSFLQENLPVRTRGVARLFLEIARHLDSERERERYEQELAWWIGVDEAQEFSKYLHKAVRGGRLEPFVIFNEVERNWRIRWPPYKSLAILDALAADDPEAPMLPIGLLGRFYWLRASLRHDYALYAEALDDASFGLRVSEGQPLAEASLHEILGLLKMRIGNYKEALHHFNRTRVMRERELGRDHPDVATILSNLGSLYCTQGKYAEADPLYQRALGIREKALGPEHPDVAQSLNNLAELYRAQGKYAQAEPLYQRALEIREKALGPEHPDVAQSPNNLARLYYAQGKYAEAEPLFQRALGIREKALGPEHPDVAQALENYALLLRQTGRESQAAEMEARAKAIRARHPSQRPS
jgi:tetratricopeptide (TPR) repeat protein